MPEPLEFEIEPEICTLPDPFIVKVRPVAVDSERYTLLARVVVPVLLTVRVRLLEPEEVTASEGEIICSGDGGIPCHDDLIADGARAVRGGEGSVAATNSEDTIAQGSIGTNRQRGRAATRVGASEGDIAGQ